MGFASGFSTGASARNQRDQLREAAKIRNEELQIRGYSFENGQMGVRNNSMAEAEQLQAQETAQLAKALQAKLLAQDTDTAFEDFANTGDATYLQRKLEQNPDLQNIWAQRGVRMVANIDFENDAKLLSRSGLEESYYDTDEKKNVLRKNMYKIYDGQDWSIGMANQAIAETGVVGRLGDRRSEVFHNNQKELVSMITGPKVSPYTAEGHKYEKEIMAAADKYGVPPNLLATMMHKESSGRVDAVSPKGARSLMQLMPDTFTGMGYALEDIDVPSVNIDAGAKYLSQMIDKYQGDVPKALAAYNAGPGNVDKYGGIPPFGETQKYVSSILANFDQGEQFYGSSADNVINTILDHRRSMANAANGTTNANVDAEVKQKDRQLNQADIALKQADRGLDLEEKGLGIRTIEAMNTARSNNIGKISDTKRKLIEADEAAINLIDTFGGEEQFYQTDFTDPKNYRKAFRLMNEMEQLEGTTPSEGDKKTISDVKQLVALSDITRDLTDDETGFIDKTLGDIGTYLSDDPDGVKSKTAYAMYRNLVRNALYGATLTDGEIKAFNESFATLGQQAGPIMASMMTSLTQLQAKFDGTVTTMNPLSAKIRIGADLDKIETIKQGFQERINYIQGLSPQASNKTNTSDAEFDNIFGAP